MAKNRYGIPYALESSYLDMEIAIQTNSGIGFRPFPIRNILMVLFGIVSCFIILSKTFVAYGTFEQKAIFVILWGLLCFMLLTSSRTKQLGIERIISVINYLQPDHRFVTTRSMSNANPFIQICGITNIDNGTIYYADGSLGQIFDIIGNGSVLLFEDHKNAIIDRVDTHYRKMRPKTTYQFVTVTESQDVYLQLASLHKKKENLTVDDPDLNAMIDTDKYVLENIVGQSFKSLHQYLIIQAPNKDEMDIALNIFWDEVDSSSQMFKYAEQLDDKEIITFMKGIYGNTDRY